MTVNVCILDAHRAGYVPDIVLSLFSTTLKIVQFLVSISTSLYLNRIDPRNL